MSALIIPCYIKTQWDIDCINRLLDSVQAQTKQFDKVCKHPLFRIGLKLTSAG